MCGRSADRQSRASSLLQCNPRIFRVEMVRLDNRGGTMSRKTSMGSSLGGFWLVFVLVSLSGAMDGFGGRCSPSKLVVPGTGICGELHVFAQEGAAGRSRNLVVSRVWPGRNQRGRRRGCNVLGFGTGGRNSVDGLSRIGE